MGTIVTYKGDMLSNIANGTVTLKVANKWIEDYITLSSSSGEGKPVYQDSEGYIVLSDIGDQVDLKTIDCSANGKYVAPKGIAYNHIHVDVPINNFLKSVVDGSVTVITQEDLPNTTKIGQYCFAHCNSLESVYLPNVTSIMNNAFVNCIALKSVYLPKIIEVNGSYTFYSCSSLEDISLPSYIGATNISLSYTFHGCSSLESVTLPLFIGIINSNVFRYCRNLKIIDCKANKINNADNFNTTNLDTLILRGDTTCTLSGIGSNFANSPFASDGTGGTLYVPAALVESYQSATNWSTILSYENNQILPIEGSIYETQYADGTPIT